MKIVLQKEVEKLGVPGDVVSVADGYARNYLIPKGFAAPATKGSAKNAERLRRAHDQKVEKSVLEARESASNSAAVYARLSGAMVSNSSYFNASVFQRWWWLSRITRTRSPSSHPRL